MTRFPSPQRWPSGGLVTTRETGIIRITFFADDYQPPAPRHRSLWRWLTGWMRS